MKSHLFDIMYYPSTIKDTLIEYIIKCEKILEKFSINFKKLFL